MKKGEEAFFSIKGQDFIFPLKIKILNPWAQFDFYGSTSISQPTKINHEFHTTDKVIQIKLPNRVSKAKNYYFSLVSHKAFETKVLAKFYSRRLELNDR
jgi:hypothetical protein